MYMTLMVIRWVRLIMILKGGVIMNIDANVVIEKLTQELSQHILDKTIMLVQIEELQKENEMLKKEGD